MLPCESAAKEISFESSQPQPQILEARTRQSSSTK